MISNSEVIREVDFRYFISQIKGRPSYSLVKNSD